MARRLGRGRGYWLAEIGLFGVLLKKPTSSRRARARDGCLRGRHRLRLGRHFRLKPAEIIASLDLLRPIYRKTTNYGHFGRNEAEFTWERTDKAEELAAAGKHRR